jgi:DNA-binding Xre family transcriptional regulator
MELSTLNGRQSRGVNPIRLRILNRMGLAERVDEAREAVKMRPADFARAVGISKAAMTLIKNGTTKTLKHETALAIQRVTGFRAEWVNNGALPKRANGHGGESAQALTAREEMVLLRFRGMTPEQQRELVLELNALVEGNRQIQARFLNKPLRTFSNEDVAAAFGTPGQGKRKPAPQRARKGPAQPEEDPE